GRYTFHDLLRAYATDLTHATDTDQQCHAVTHRMLDHYLHTAHTAARLLDPARPSITLTPPQPGTAPEHPADHQQALGSFTTEHAAPLAATANPPNIGSAPHPGHRAWPLWLFPPRGGHGRALPPTRPPAVAAAPQLGDPTAQCRAHCLLAHAYNRLGRFD